MYVHESSRSSSSINPRRNPPQCLIRHTYPNQAIGRATNLKCLIWELESCTWSLINFYSRITITNIAHSHAGEYCQVYQAKLQKAMENTCHSKSIDIKDAAEQTVAVKMLKGNLAIQPYWALQLPASCIIDKQGGEGLETHYTYICTLTVIGAFL